MLVPHRQCGGCKIFLCHLVLLLLLPSLLPSSSATFFARASLLYRQLTVPIGDDGQQMSGGPPVLWLSTNAVQLTVPIGDDGQLMSGGPPVL